MYSGGMAGTLLALVAAWIALPVLGAGFAIQENSASGLGNAFAGGAAAAADATTVWSNPAGMSRLDSSQAASALNLIAPSLNFSNDASTSAFQQPLGDSGDDAGGRALVPNGYFTTPINMQWSLGLGVNAPFGLESEYHHAWIGRFQGLKSNIKTVNVNGAVSWVPGDGVAVGLGANYQHIEATFTGAANYSAALLSAAAHNGIAPGSPTFNAIASSTAGLESGADINGRDYAWGWNLGVLVDVDRNHRIGAQYRSAIEYSISGNVSFTNPPLPALAPPLSTIVGQLSDGINDQVLYDSGIRSKIELPETANLSYFGRLNEQWDLLVDIQYTGWSSIRQLTFTRGNGSPLQTTDESFEDAWRLAVGASYHYDNKWLVRGGLAYDASPVQDSDRTVRLPDSDRIWLALGTKYQMTTRLWFDVAAAYVWINNANIDDIGSNNLGVPPNAAQNARVNGDYDNHTVIVSGQIGYSFGQ